MEPQDTDPSKRRFIVCIDEVQQNFAFGERFAGRYSKTVTLSDGTPRTIELRPMRLEGKTVVELQDGAHCSYMGPHGTTINGKLMIQLRDYDAMLEAQQEWRGAMEQSSPVFPPKTSLLSLPDFVPPGFVHGVEILNDNTTPMRFVVDTLTSHAGLESEAANRAMLDIHRRGGALLPTTSQRKADEIAAGITAEATRLGYPLVCRSVRVGS